MPDAYLSILGGGYLDYDRPEQTEFNIMGIARALSWTPRFVGQTSCRYSVAEHSILVSYLVKPELALAGLLHDAHEAYIGDLSTPFKRKFMNDDFRVFEHDLKTSMWYPLGTPGSHYEVSMGSPEVKAADIHALYIEKMTLLPEHVDDVWEVLSGFTPADICLSPPICKDEEQAMHAFLNRYTQLKVLANEQAKQSTQSATLN